MSRQREALLHQLPGMQLVGPHLEDEADRRQTGDRLGAQDIKLRRAPELLLQGQGDQVLHFGRGHADAFGLDLHQGRRELREDIDRHGAYALRAEVHQRRRDGDHQETELQAGPDDPAHHRREPLRAFIFYRIRYRAVPPPRPSRPPYRGQDRPTARPGPHRCGRP